MVSVRTVSCAQCDRERRKGVGTVCVKHNKHQKERQSQAPLLQSGIGTTFTQRISHTDGFAVDLESPLRPQSGKLVFAWAGCWMTPLPVISEIVLVTLVSVEKDQTAKAITSQSSSLLAWFCERIHRCVPSQVQPRKRTGDSFHHSFLKQRVPPKSAVLRTSIAWMLMKLLE